MIYYNKYFRQIDLRKNNSWSKSIYEISPFECLEVNLINSIVPFYLNGQFKPSLNMMTRTC